MKRAFFVLFIALMSSSPAVSSTFSLAAFGAANYGDSAMITWVSPVTGTITISGNAWTTSQTSDVAVEWIPASLAPTINNPGNGVGGALEGGTSPLVNGTVQHSATGNYFESQADPANFGTSYSIPCGNGNLGCVSANPGALKTLTVSKGDMIAAVIENYYLFGGDTVGLSLGVQITGNTQGSGGTLANPQLLTTTSSGFGGTLNPSASHSTDAYEFYWGGGDFSGTAVTDAIFGASTIPAGFQSGMGLALYSSPTDVLLSSLTVLNSSASSSSFDFGSVLAGNYVLQVTDLNSNDDPPYNLEFNGSVGAPNGQGTTPEPSMFLLVGTALLAGGYWRRRRT